MGSKHILETLRKLVDMKGQCTLEEIVRFSGKPEFYALDVLHKNRELLIQPEKDEALYLGDKCKEMYEDQEKEGTKTWWKLDPYYTFRGDLQRLLVTDSIVFTLPKNCTAYEAQKDLKTWNYEDTCHLQDKGWKWARQNLSSNGVGIIKDISGNKKILKSRGYCSKEGLDFRIKDDIEKGLHNNIWKE